MRSGVREVSTATREAWTSFPSPVKPSEVEQAAGVAGADQLLFSLTNREGVDPTGAPRHVPDVVGVVAAVEQMGRASQLVGEQQGLLVVAHGVVVEALQVFRGGPADPGPRVGNEAVALIEAAGDERQRRPRVA